MSASLDRLRKIMPTLPSDLGTVNRGSYEKNLPLETSRIVREFNVFDELLYQDAVEMLAKQEIASEIPESEVQNLSTSV